MGEGDEGEPSASAATTRTTGPSYGTVCGVTSETSVRSASESPADDADLAAKQAADTAGVRIVELHDLADLRSAAELYQTVWQTDARTAPVSPDLMRALSHAGGYVSGAFEGARLVGASLAFHTGTANTAEGGLHSHISGVLADVQGRDIGRALKLHQRSWALHHGLKSISWTYDPLIRRNAWFNISKLGARAVGYLVDFYGVMDDAQNAGDESDRAVALWNLEERRVSDAARGVRSEPDMVDLLARGAVLALSVEADRPVVRSVPTGAPSILVQVPQDIQLVRTADPGLARQWRETCRGVLEPLLAGTYVATGFTRTGFYVLEEISE